jgi:hypothetical protein
VGDERDREFDLDQVRQRAMMLWSDAIDAELASFRAAVALQRAEWAGDPAAVAAIDQAASELRDKARRARRRLHRARGKLRRLQSADDPSQPQTS